MTKAGKCETCRQKKIKCDERRPTCEVCDRKGRVCIYSKVLEDVFIQEHVGNANSVDSSNVHDISATASSCSASLDTDRNSLCNASYAQSILRLKRIKGAETGRGQFLTFKPIPWGTTLPRTVQQTSSYEVMLATGRLIGDHIRISPCPSPRAVVPMNPQETLLSGLVFTLGPSVFDIAPFGDWIKSPWACTENELAIQYMMMSIQLFQNRNDHNLELACRAGRRAIRILRERIEIETDEEGRLNILHAIMMHYTAEQFICLGSFYYVPHVHGASGLIGLFQAQWSDNEAVQSIASVLCEDEVTTAMMADRSTYLEDYTRRVHSVAGVSDLNSAAVVVQHILYQLPRLVRLARQAISNPSDLDVIGQAVDMATNLYNSDADSCTKQTVQACSIEQPTSSSSIVAPKEESVFDFPCVQSYTLALQYYLYRVTLCGVLQTLHQIPTASIPIDIAEIQATDVESARYIAKCTDYGLRSSALVALKMIIPLQVSFGSWRRLRKRQRSADTAEYLHAERMEWWHIKTVNIFVDMWNSVQTDYHRMGMVADAWAGGPMESWMFEYRVPGFV